MATPYPRRYRPILKAASRRYHIPARVLAAQEFVESGFAEDVIAGRRKSSAGAYGISQFIASTGRQYGVRAGTSKRAVKTQVFGHARYLRDLGYAKSPRNAIASYAGGPGNPQGWYADKVLALAPSYRGVVRGVKPGSGGGGSVVGGRPASSTRSAQGVGGTALAELTAKALQRQQGPPSFTLPAAPAHTAHVTLPEGQVAGPPQSGLVTPQQSEPSLQELLAAASADARVQDARSTVTPAVAGRRTGGGGNVAPGGAGTGAAQAAARLGPKGLLELYWQGAGGINVKNGARQPQGFVDGHTDHVHVAANRKLIVKLGRLAQKMGLHVGENPHFGGVAPVHVTNSNHYVDKAIDVSGDAALMRKYAHRVARLFGI